MIQAVKQIVMVGKEGKIEINAPELPEGTEVEIIILVKSSESDTTEYLLSSEANRQKIFEAISRVKNRENLQVITPDTWHEKYSF